MFDRGGEIDEIGGVIDVGGGRDVLHEVNLEFGERFMSSARLHGHLRTTTQNAPFLA